MKIKSIAQIGTCILMGLIGIGIYAYRYVYPKHILETYSDAWPSAWNSDLYNLNHKQIIEKLGPPDGDFSAKDFQSWQKIEPWGTFQLDITFANCCNENTIPERINKIMRLNNRYEPLENKLLSKDIKK